MKVFAPGKLILSGEHAAVLGKPALAMAVNRYVVVTTKPQLLPFISFDLSDLSYKRRFTLNALDHLKNRIKNKYKKFLHGDFKIREVLNKPVELAQIAFSLFFESFNMTLTQGINIHVQSDIPMGCGMGSSAATILGMVKAIANHFQIELSPETFYRLGLQAENLQHGFSSGLDLRVSLYGGCIFVKNGEVHTRPIPQLPMYLVNTGTPDTTTGECVTTAAKHFKDSSLGDEFAAVTESMDAALQTNQVRAIKQAIQANHQLLVQIGIVPSLPQHFIHGVEEIGGAAKICGAGAVSGNKAGVIWVITEDKPALENLCNQFGYSIIPIQGETRGVHVVGASVPEGRTEGVYVV